VRAAAAKGVYIVALSRYALQAMPRRTEDASTSSDLFLSYVLLLIYMRGKEWFLSPSLSSLFLSLPLLLSDTAPLFPSLLPPPSPLSSSSFLFFFSALA